MLVPAARRWTYSIYRRIRARSARHLVRSALLSVWPFSDVVHRFYQARMRPERWDAINARAKAEWAKNRSDLDSSQKGALRDLCGVGIHLAVAGSLLKSKFDLAAVKHAAARLLDSPEIRRQIDRRRSSEGIKWYVVRAFGYKPHRLVPAEFASVVLNDRILDIANAYLGLNSRMIYLDLWYNFAVTEREPPIDSEYWHRDGEDRKLVKLFLYLSDVDRNTGPLTYLLQSQPGGARSGLFPNDPPKGSFPPKDQLHAIERDSQVISCEGPAGTMVLYDPCGLHRGGRAHSAARVVLVATYGSDAATDVRRYRLEDSTQYSRLSSSASYAIYAN